MRHKNSFIAKKDRIDYTETMSDHEKVMFYEAIWNYQLWNDVWDVSFLWIAWNKLKKEMDESNWNYEKICKQNSEKWKNHVWNQYTEWDEKRKGNDKAQKKVVEQMEQTEQMEHDSDSDIWLLSKDNNVEESTEQKNVNEMLYTSYPFKDKWVDKEVCDKLIDKQFKKWSTLNWMLKEMKLELLEMRVKQWTSHRYWRKMETWLREYVEWMADSEDRLRELLSYHRKRLESWPPYRKNPRDELCDLFGADYVKKLFMETKQWVKLFTT